MFKNLRFSKNYIYLFFIFSFSCFFMCKFEDVVDIWFLLSHGRYVLNNGFPYTEILSMHEGFNFVMQQWLSSVIFYVIYNYLGKISFYIFLLIINCIITLLIYKLCLIISDNKKFSSCFISIISMFLLQIGFIAPRPQIFSFIILIVILIMLELFSSKRKKLIYFMPLISILSINLHASMWPMIFIFCMPYVAELILKKDKDVLFLLGIIFISILVGFINPYGLDAMTYSFKSYGYKDIVTVVGEMSSFNLTGTNYVRYLSYLILFIFFISNIISLFNSNKNNNKIAHMFLFYGTFIMSLISLRNIPLFIIGTIPFLVKYFEFQDDNKFYLNKGWVINYIIIILIFIGVFTVSIKDKKYELDSSVKDVVLYIDECEDKDIKIYTDYSSGAMFEYYGFRPYLDARAEVFIKNINGREDILKEYIDFNLKEKSRDKFIKKYDFDYYVVDEENYNLINYLINYKDIKYEIVFVGTDTYLIKKVS